MDKFKKIDKEFQLTDSSVNSYGFRLLTSGYLMAEFAKNPIGYYMHGKETDHPRSEGVLVKWDDLRQEDDKVFGKPVINLSHPRGQRTVDEVESGFLNAASLGHFVVLEMDKNPSNFLPGQVAPTVTKWYNRECSLVDIPGNFNALTLYDADGDEINLADFTKEKKSTMEKIFLTAEQLSKINLKADAKSTEFEKALEDLVANAAKVPGLETSLAAANTAKETAETELVTLKKVSTEKEIDVILGSALADGKVTVELSTVLKDQYATNPTGLKDLVAKMPVYKSVTGTIQAAEQNSELTDLVAKDYDVLDKEGKLPRLRELSAEQFQVKYKAKFGKEYKA